MLEQRPYFARVTNRSKLFSNPFVKGRFISLLAVAGVGLFGRAAESGTNDWRVLLAQARAASRTNSTVAISLCDRAIAISPMNAAPWVMRGAIEDSRREYDKALKDVSEALRLEPSLDSAYQLRGTIHFKMSRFRESVADFDRFLERVPSQGPYHWQRGISLYYAGDYEAGQKQFELHQSVNPNDVENSVWHFLCVARRSGVKRARELMLKCGPDRRVPMTEIYELYAGYGSVEQVEKAALGKAAPESSFYSALYLALYFSDVQTNVTRSREFITKAVDLDPSHYMGDVARVHAKLPSR